MYEMDADTLAERSRKLTEDASCAFAYQDYTPEDIMRMLVECLALQRDTLEALLRFRRSQVH